MSDQFTEDFFTWMANSSLSPKDIAEKTGNRSGTVANWRSEGIPKGKRFACEALMNEHLSKKVAEMQEGNAVIPLKISSEQFRAWSLAAIRGETPQIVEDWAIAALDELAAQDPVVAGIDSTSPAGQMSDLDDAESKDVGGEDSIEAVG